MRSSIIAVFLCMLVHSSSLAQGRIYDIGQSGFTGSVASLSNGDSWGVGVDLVHSFTGDFDFGLALLWHSFDEALFGPDFSGYSIAPRVAYALAKPENGAGFGFDLSIAYQYGSFSGNYSST